MAARPWPRASVPASRPPSTAETDRGAGACAAVAAIRSSESRRWVPLRQAAAEARTAVRSAVRKSMARLPAAARAPVRAAARSCRSAAPKKHLCAAAASDARTLWPAAAPPRSGSVRDRDRPGLRESSGRRQAAGSASRPRAVLFILALAALRRLPDKTGRCSETEQLLRFEAITRQVLLIKGAETDTSEQSKSYCYNNEHRPWSARACRKRLTILPAIGYSLPETPSSRWRRSCSP